jgi:hypothetical protein
MEYKSAGRGRGSPGACYYYQPGSSAGRLGKIAKTSFKAFKASSSIWKKRHPSSLTGDRSFRGISRGRGYHHGSKFTSYLSQPRQASHRSLDFQYLMRLASDNVEPSEVIRCIADPENDLGQHLKENMGNIEYLELIIVALGLFCKKNGTSQFSESFVVVVKILAAQNIFSHITSMIINVPISRASDLPAKEERLKRLTTAIFHLATEILVKMPALACQCLGEHFFTDIISLKAMPSVKNLNAADAFDIFEDGIQQLQVSNYYLNILQSDKLVNSIDFNRLHGINTSPWKSRIRTAVAVVWMNTAGMIWLFRIHQIISER